MYNWFSRDDSYFRAFGSLGGCAMVANDCIFYDFGRLVWDVVKRMTYYIYQIYRRPRGIFRYYIGRQPVNEPYKKEWLEYDVGYWWWVDLDTARRRCTRFLTQKAAEKALLSYFSHIQRKEDLKIDFEFGGTSIVQMKPDGRKILIDRLIES